MRVVERLADLGLAFSFVEEEHLTLLLFLVGMAGHVDGFHRRRVDAGVVHLGAQRHGRRREVLNLLQTVTHVFHLHSQLGHVLQTATGMTADEIWYQLVAQARLLAYLIEAPFRFFK